MTYTKRRMQMDAYRLGSMKEYPDWLEDMKDAGDFIPLNNETAETDRAYQVRTKGGEFTKAWDGQWVVRFYNGDIYVYSDKKFRENYVSEDDMMENMEYLSSALKSIYSALEAMCLKLDNLEEIKKILSGTNPETKTLPPNGVNEDGHEYGYFESSDGDELVAINLDDELDDEDDEYKGEDILPEDEKITPRGNRKGYTVRGGNTKAQRLREE